MADDVLAEDERVVDDADAVVIAVVVDDDHDEGTFGRIGRELLLLLLEDTPAATVAGAGIEKPG